MGALAPLSYLVTYNDITYNRFYLNMTLLIIVNKNKYVILHLLMLEVMPL